MFKRELKFSKLFVGVLKWGHQSRRPLTGRNVKPSSGKEKSTAEAKLDSSVRFKSQGLGDTLAKKASPGKSEGDLETKEGGSANGERNKCVVVERKSSRHKVTEKTSLRNPGSTQTCLLSPVTGHVLTYCCTWRD